MAAAPTGGSAGTAPDPRASIGVLIVGWYPAADDVFAGRFIADQAEALRATGSVRPEVLSFEPFWLHGDIGIRTGTAEAWPRLARPAIRQGRLFIEPAANGAAGIPVARLGAPAGRTMFDAADNEATHRGASLSAALDALGPAAKRWQLVHAHVGYPDGAAVAIATLGRRLPFVMTEHATYLDRLWADPTVRARYLAGAKAARRIIAVSRVLADRIEGAFEELRGRVVVIPNTVDIDAFAVTHPGDRDPDELLWVGYRREVKGMVTLLRAFAAVHARRPSTRLRLVGRSTTDEEEDGWHRIADELGVAESIRFEGPADRRGVADAMARAALFVHPSRVETMGVVAVEALAAGLPVVATDSGGVTEVLGPDPRAAGALVPADDPEALAEAILATLERRTSMAPEGLRAHVATRYGAPAVAARLVGLYREVLAESEPRATDLRSLVRRSGLVARPDDRRPPAPIPGPALRGFEGRVIIVGFDRPYLNKLLQRFPDSVFEGAILVSAGGLSLRVPRAELPPSEAASQVSAYLGTGISSGGGARSIRGRIRGARTWLRRLRDRRRLNRRTLPILQATLDHGLERVGATRDAPALVVCLGGIDVFVARRAVESGRAVMAPGGLRWLGDARWAETAPAAARRDASATGAPPA